jgi:F0F1-type ATP synthase assembly protein I
MSINGEPTQDLKKGKIARSRSSTVAVGDLGSVGFTLVFATLIGIYGGRYLGLIFGQETFGTVTGLIIGVSAGFHQLYKSANRWLRSQERQDQALKENEN